MEVEWKRRFEVAKTGSWRPPRRRGPPPSRDPKDDDEYQVTGEEIVVET